MNCPKIGRFPTGFVCNVRIRAWKTLISQTTSLQENYLDYVRNSGVGTYAIYRLLDFDGEINVLTNKLFLPCFGLHHFFFCRAYCIFTSLA